MMPGETPQTVTASEKDTITSRLLIAIGTVCLTVVPLFFIKQYPQLILSHYIAVGLALTFNFLGGKAQAQGKLPFIKNSMSFVLGGSTAVYFITLIGMLFALNEFYKEEESPFYLPVNFHFKSSEIGDINSLYFRQEYPAQSNIKPEELIGFSNEIDTVFRTFVKIPKQGEKIDLIIKPGEGAVESGEPESMFGVSVCRKITGCFPKLEAISFDCSYNGKDNGCSLKESCGSYFSNECQASAINLDQLLLSSAYARSDAAEEHEIGWRIPSIESLSTPTKNRPAYTLFHLQSSALENFPNADRYIYRIYVNEIPVYIDGLSPEILPKSLDPKQGIDLKFGIPPLNFSGKFDGFEKVSITIDFYNKNNLLKSYTIESKGVAYRDWKHAVKQYSDGFRMTLDGLYSLPVYFDRFGIMVKSSLDPEILKSAQKKIAEIGKTYEGQTAVGILRPPLTPWRLQNRSNPYWGLIIGMTQPTGQIKGSFSEDEAKSICAWIVEHLEDFEGAIESDSYRYEWGKKGFVACTELR